MGTLPPLISGEMLSAQDEANAVGARAKIATVTADRTTSKAILRMRGPMRLKTATGRGWLPETLALRLEHHLAGETPGEAEEAGVGDHPVGRPHAPSPHRPASLEELVRLQH